MDEFQVAAEDPDFDVVTCMPVPGLPPREKGGVSCLLTRLWSWCNPSPFQQGCKDDDESKPLLQTEVPTGDENPRRNAVFPASGYDQTRSHTIRPPCQQFFDEALTNGAVSKSALAAPDALECMQPSKHTYVQCLWSSSQKLVKPYEVVPTLHLLSSVAPKWPSCGRIDFEEVSVEYG